MSRDQLTTEQIQYLKDIGAIPEQERFVARSVSVYKPIPKKVEEEVCSEEEEMSCFSLLLIFGIIVFIVLIFMEIV